MPLRHAHLQGARRLNGRTRDQHRDHITKCLATTASKVKIINPLPNTDITINIDHNRLGISLSRDRPSSTRIKTNNIMAKVFDHLITDPPIPTRLNTNQTTAIIGGITKTQVGWAHLTTNVAPLSPHQEPPSRA